MFAEKSLHLPDAARNSFVRRLALWTIPVSVLVLGIKFLAWHLTGSVALFSDALESIINVLAALMAFWAIRIAQVPPDENHPFGHYKAEYFSSIIEGVLIVVAALLILREAIPALFAPPTIAAPALGLAITCAATAINATWAILLIRAGREHRSQALETDGQHLMTDVLTSVSIVVGLTLSVITGLTILDPLLAIAVALNILRTGWKIIRSSVDVLMDGAATQDDGARIEKTILSHAGGAHEVHDLRIRRVGPALFVEFHLVVDGEMSVTDSHTICDRIEAAVQDLEPRAHISIHVEPSDKAKSGGLVVDDD